MNAREHALHAKLLVEACGGPREASAACRVSEGQLSKFGDVRYGLFMPMDVVDALESYSGQRTYSRALADDRPVDGSSNLLNDACEGSEGSLALQALIRKIVLADRLTPAECDQARRLLAHVTDTFRRVGDGLARTGKSA